MIGLNRQIPKRYQSLPHWVDFLSNIQANIIKHHGRKHARFVFIRFTNTNQIDAIKQWIVDFSTHITSAYKQLMTRRGDPEEIVCTLFFSREGMEWLNLRDINFSKEEYTKLLTKTDDQNGNLEEHVNGGSHVMILLAHSEPVKIRDFIEDEIYTSLRNQRLQSLNFTEEGAVMENEQGKHIEPFGYRDGLSQPELLKGRSPNNPNALWNSAANLNLAFFKLPRVEDYGSFAVYLKIKQDVEAFDRNIKFVAEEIQDENLNADEKKELAAAYLMGRFRDGTPVVLSNKPLGGEPTNDFNYGIDNDRNRCPGFAHTYKTNPREKKYRKVRIIRRGIPFESRDGLHFLSYQNNIDKQFINMYNNWITNPMNPDGSKRSGKDPIMVTDQDGGTKQIPPQWDQNPALENAVGNELEKPSFVKGIVFFFVPSLKYLKNLAAQ